MAKYCDVILVTSENIKEFFEKTKPTFIRPIPSNIEIGDFKKQYNKQFVYFGLINKSKAFDEMIKGWKLFKNGDNNGSKLLIVTSSKVNMLEEELKKYNIELLIGADNADVASKLIESSFAVLPIIPSIGPGNGSCWSSLEAGNIPVGIFGSDNSFSEVKYIGLENYEPNSFAKAFYNCSTIDEATFYKYSSINERIGKDRKKNTYGVVFEQCVLDNLKAR